MGETRFLALAIASTLLLACFSPDIPPGLTCGPGSACPPGEHCEPSLSICVPTELAPVAGLRFVASPTTVEALSTTPSVRLELVDAEGQRVALDGGSFTLALDAGHTGVQMSGARAMPASAGVVTFTGLVFDRPGRGLTLSAHSATGLAATSPSFEVTATPPAVSELAPPASVEGCAAIPYTLTQAQGLPVDLLVEVDPDGPAGPLPYRRATQAASAPGMAGVQGVRGTAAGAARQFSWNSSADLPGVDAAAELRLTPTTGSVAGAALRAAVQVSNGPRYQATVDQDAEPNLGLFAVEVTDMDADGWPDVVTGDVAAVEIRSRHGATVQVGVGVGATVTLATGDFNGDGLRDVAIGRDTGLFLILQQRSPRRSFAAPAPAGFASSIRKLVSADFDHDGLDDLAALLGDGDVVVLRQQRTPAGRFVEVARPFTGGGASQLLLADLDRDGTPDLVIGRDSPSAPVAIVRADRHGFAAPDTSGGLLGDVLAVGDLDHDGKDDLAAVHADGLHVLTGAGAAASLPGLHADRIAIADLDGDGRNDLILARAGTVAFRPHVADRSDPGFGAERKIGDAGGVLAIVAADVDRDGRVDVLTPADLGQGVCLVTTFQSTTARACGRRLGGPRATAPISASNQLRLADFDADGKVDLVDNYGGSVQLAPGLGDGSFSSTVTQLAVPDTTITGWIFDLVAGDLDGDRLPDLAWVADQNDVVQLLYDDPAAPGTFVAKTLPTVIFPIALASADVDGDGTPDLVTMGSSQIVVWHGDPAGVRGAYTADTLPFTVEANQDLCANDAPCELTTGDVNGDGVVDLVVMTRDTLQLVLGDRAAPHGFDEPIAVVLPFMRFLGVGNVVGDGADEILLDGGADVAHNRLTAWSVHAAHTTLEPVWELILGEDTYARAAFADLDGDGHPELALEGLYPTFSTNLLSPARLASQSPIPHDQLASFGGPLAFADVDGDAALELVVASATWGAYVVDVGEDGVADFDVALDHVGLPVSDVAGRTAFGDFSGDGLVDLATVDTSHARLVAQSSAHPGTLEASDTSLPGTGFVALADLDGDRRADLVTDGVLSSLGELSRADASFEPICPGEHATWPAATGDVDGDGYADLVFVADHDVQLVVSPALACAAPVHLFDFRAPGSSDFRPVGVALADVNADGRLDVVTLSEPVRVALQSASVRGTFEAPAAYPSLMSGGNYCTDGVVVDIDRDGALDVVTGDGQAIAILHGDPDARGAFGAVEKFFMVEDVDHDIKGFSTMLSGDVDGDGWPDLVLANASQSFVLRQSPGNDVRFPEAYAVQGHGIYSFGPVLRDSAFGTLVDFDADGKLDYVFTDPALGTRLVRGR